MIKDRNSTLDHIETEDVADDADESDANKKVRDSAYYRHRVREIDAALADAIDRKEISTHAAARQLGIVKPKTTSFEIVKRNWLKLTADERRQYNNNYLIQINTFTFGFARCNSASRHKQTFPMNTGVSQCNEKFCCYIKFRE